jgi:hypothetical protein
MSKLFKATTSVTGGTLKFHLYRAEDHALMGQISNNEALQIPLEEGKSYVMDYQVISQSDNCHYTVKAEVDGRELWNISVNLRKDDIDYNSQKFNV